MDEATPAVQSADIPVNRPSYRDPAVAFFWRVNPTESVADGRDCGDKKLPRLTVEPCDLARDGGTPELEVGDQFLGILHFQNGLVSQKGVNGTTNECVLQALINRLKELNEGEFRCKENSCAITHLQEALLWLNERTRERTARGVEGTYHP